MCIRDRVLSASSPVGISSGSSPRVLEGGSAGDGASFFGAGAGSVVSSGAGSCAFWGAGSEAPLTGSSTFFPVSYTHLDVYKRQIQKREAPDKATCIGSGRLEELREVCENTGVDLVIFDLELSATQHRNLTDALPCRVVDRTTLILDIFAARARSAEGRLQVELAQLEYLLPRLAGQGTALSRLGGGIGTRGPGETKLESDRRHIRRRIHALKEQLEAVENRREHRRARRRKDGVCTVAIVGYTNAGKSTPVSYTHLDVYKRQVQGLHRMG